MLKERKSKQFHGDRQVNLIGIEEAGPITGEDSRQANSILKRLLCNLYLLFSTGVDKPLVQKVTKKLLNCIFWIEKRPTVVYTT